MLKKITVADLKLGMFVHKLEGSWFDHPFWKAKFLIEDLSKLSEIKESRVRSVVIDTEKGVDVGDRASTTGLSNAKDCALPAVARARKIKRRANLQSNNSEPVSLEREVASAARIVEQARERLGKVFIDARLGKALDVRKVEPVVMEILASVRRNPQAFSGLMRCKLKNEAIFRHALSVSALMVSLADRMKLTSPEVYNCGLAGLLLDIGVNYLPNPVDPWSGGRRQADQRIWQSHVLLGYRALQNGNALPSAVLDACLLHHERLDGRGYPQRRAGDHIPQVARMAAICDSFEFLLTGAYGQPAMDPAAAVSVLRNNTGAFDEDILRIFIETVGLYPVGAFVELASRKIAMVIDEDPKDPMRPVVQAFYSLERRERILQHRIVLAENVDDRIVGSADLTGLELPAEEQLRELVFLGACRTIPNH